MNAPAKIALPGDNKPELINADQLARDYAHVEAAIEAALALAADTPMVIEDEEDISICREAVKQIMKEHKRAEALRVESKNPYLEAGRVVDSYFSNLMKRLADVQSSIEVRTKRYLDKKHAEERARREEEARTTRAIELRRQEEAAEAARAAAEERRKADAAIAAAAKADADQRAEAERVAAQAKALADAKEREASEAHQKELNAAAAANEAKRASEEKPADLARTRASGGGMATLQQVWLHTVVDWDKVDLESLRPFIRRDELDKAIAAFVRSGKRELAGVRIYQDTKSSFR